MANPQFVVGKDHKSNCQNCFVCKKSIHGKKFNRITLQDVLFNIFAENGGSIVGQRTMKNLTTELLSRSKDY